MIWRCTVLYSGVSLLHRRIILAVCFIMTVVSTAGIAPFGSTNLTLVIFSAITLTVNCTVTFLIVGRLLYHRNYLSETLGPCHGSPYMRLTALFIESASLVVIFDIALIILAGVEPQKGHPLVLGMMVQIYAISPFLIIFKVAYDKVYHQRPTCIQTQDLQDVKLDKTLTALQFAQAPS
ncbi:hypothetical protein CPB84DRAFT_1803851 [Gymnopilus junonius]|uniref:Uncharacterized protein n=1 Tax=Gymnopilus junonius TaxID=109634 RepID=A0A9P5N8R2_GYMJU|nr:hypothetical protein CPB84DRAFT_1803851 [Gymnopilus junonius]